jgi:MAF protein
MGSSNPTAAPRSFRLRLASESPRRRELLKLTGWEFSAAASNVDETVLSGEPPLETAQRLARQKVLAVPAEPGEWVLAADTIVVHGGRILGKPADPAEAEAMLIELRGGEHEVVTALTLIDPASGLRIEEACTTTVPMRDYSLEDVRMYVASGSPFDKAGGYGIQEASFHPVRRDEMDGCYANVMGLPLCHLVRAARQLGYEPPADVPASCTAYLDYDCKAYPAILRGGV